MSSRKKSQSFPSSSAWRFWVDRGGTFTDVVGRTPDGGVVARKILTDNPNRPGDAVAQGVRDILRIPDSEPVPDEKIAAVKMGTTAATNALLTRSGARTLLAVTRGFADLPVIGFQNRPELFNLNISRQTPVHNAAVEINERVSASGKIIAPLDERQARRELQNAYDGGFRAVAVVLTHGWKFPRHENRVAEIAREVGFAQVTSGRDASPLMRVIPRMHTAAADAHISPVLNRHIGNLAREFPSAKMMFMRSNGGLASAENFRGKDAVLSGPAGGVVGMAKVAEAAGFKKVIGFDMGGTSTDVSHYDGELERAMETEIAGARLRAPMMKIHTVAAGGGSVLQFKGGRFRVGPDSAGANPGPKCYRRNGPLAVTDCNVALGRIQPKHFPHVFGAKGDMPLDAGAARKHFAALAKQVNRESGAAMSTEEVAEGFLRVAVDNMASAVKKISVQQGRDISEYALNCFGGAGGQHACRVADALGIRAVILHPLAGALSALGMGLAELRAMRERQIEKPLTSESVLEMKKTGDILAKSAAAEVRGSGGENVRIARRVYLRRPGSHQSLPVPFADAKTMRAAFAKAHRIRFGFYDSKTANLTAESISVEAVGDAESAPEFPRVAKAPKGESRPDPLEFAKMFCGGRWRRVPLHRRETLLAGHRIEGPAIVCESTATTIVEDEWTAKTDSLGNLILTRGAKTARRAKTNSRIKGGADARAKPDPVALEIFNNLFMFAAERMGATLANTAYSVNIKERLDFSCALFDAKGGLVANAPHVPVHLGSMGASVREVIRRNRGRMLPGDAFMLNNPFAGGTHLPDVTVVSPVFDDGGRRILFYVGSRGHHADIGGSAPGSAPPDSRTIHDEGVVVDNFHLVKSGRLREREARELLASGKWPCRNINENIADLTAQVAANETGVREARAMVSHFGLRTVRAYMRHVRDNAEEAVRRAVGRLRGGEFECETDDGKRVRVAVRINHRTRDAVLDFTGTSRQDAGNYNAPLAVCRAAALYVFRCLAGDDIPLNEGCMAPLKLIAPLGTILNPRRPAAVIAGNTEVSQCVADALLGACGALAGSQGTMNNFVWGDARAQNYETICGGAGAGPGFAGADAVHTHMTNTRLTDPEALEFRFPVRVEEFRIRRGSGGSGRWRGGDGAVRRLRFLRRMTATVLTSRRLVAPHGMAGGGAGLPGRNAIERADGRVEELRGNDKREVFPGDVFVMETPGGGGWGRSGKRGK